MNYLHIFHIFHIAYISYIALTKSEMMLYMFKYFNIFYSHILYISIFYLHTYWLYNLTIYLIIYIIYLKLLMLWLLYGFMFLYCWFISAGDARMATGQSDAPWQPNTPGQPDAPVGHRDLMTGVIDDFGNCQSQMMFHDWYDCQITHVWYFYDVIDVVMFDCLSNFLMYLMWPYISECNTLHFCV